MFGQTAADGASFLRAEVERQILLVLVRFPESGLLLLRNDGEHLGDRQPHDLDLRELVGGAAGDLRHPQQRQLRLQILQLRQQLRLVLLPQLVHLNPS